MTSFTGAIRRAARRRGFSCGRYPHTGSIDDHLAEVMARMSIDHVLDVGANDGGYVRRLRDDVGYRGRVSSFEPSAATYARLVDAAAGDVAWGLYPFALGSVSENGTLYRSSMSVLNSLHVATEYGREEFGVDQSTTESVVVRRLDDVWTSIAGLTPQTCSVFLKIDTQGHDFSVLEGAAGVLHLINGLQMEVPLRPIYQGVPSLAQVLAELEQLGFSCTGIFPVSRDAELRLVEVDIIALREP